MDLTEDMDLNVALPCRVSGYSEGGKTKIGMMTLSAMLKVLSDEGFVTPNSCC